MLEIIQCLLGGAFVAICAIAVAVVTVFLVKHLLSKVVACAFGIPVFVASLLIAGVGKLSKLLR